MRPGVGSRDQIDRTRPGLMAIGLRDAQIDRQVLVAGKRHRMLGGDAPAPFGLRKPIDPDLPAETAALEGGDAWSAFR